MDKGEIIDDHSCNWDVRPNEFSFGQFYGLLTTILDQMANILLLDSPVGSGFSFARDPKGYDVGDYSSSSQVQIFLNKVMRGIADAVPSYCFAWRTSERWLLSALCMVMYSGSRIIRNSSQILSTLVEIHMLERWFHLLHKAFHKVIISSLHHCTSMRIPECIMTSGSKGTTKSYVFVQNFES